MASISLTFEEILGSISLSTGALHHIDRWFPSDMECFGHSCKQIKKAIEPLAWLHSVNSKSSVSFYESKIQPTWYKSSCTGEEKSYTHSWISSFAVGLPAC